jgi:hypothetical protein
VVLAHHTTVGRIDLIKRRRRVVELQSRLPGEVGRGFEREPDGYAGIHALAAGVVPCNEHRRGAHEFEFLDHGVPVESVGLLPLGLLLTLVNQGARPAFRPLQRLCFFAVDRHVFLV